MSSELKDITVTGLISRILERYVVTTDDGTEYELSAILPWEAVAPDHGTHVFAQNLGKKMTVSGQCDGYTIYGASLSPID
ncbi:MAG: hypothetical protein JSW61_08500 [Candidatus Thorarchaeota archaeon]|nr:MAG: hypothetical protein JSW61_08500 [Candidatus Thorarchaeota archaeon]